jgi:hypothetical protein
MPKNKINQLIIILTRPYPEAAIEIPSLIAHIYSF